MSGPISATRLFIASFSSVSVFSMNLLIRM